MPGMTGRGVAAETVDSVSSARARARLVDWLPPALSDRLRRYFGSLRFVGDYDAWADAMLACQGYAADSILERVERAATAVREGRAAFERDGVAFSKMQRAWPILANLLWIAQQRDGRLHVLDLGGSLGSSYQQSKSFLEPLRELQWSVVEQPHFVERGQLHFEDAVLRFFPDLVSARQAGRPDVALLSGVLPYVEDPYGMLDSVLEQELEYLLLDRTPLIEGERDRLMVQRLSGHLGDASYPAWFFSRTKFLRWFSGRYRLLEEFDSEDRVHVRARYQGFLFQRIGGRTHAG
ncbi:MAG: Radical domain protein [Myxococcaceae bacterium]|nr:Radical domain protein [Myxococcaceae bacterium]